MTHAICTWSNHWHHHHAELLLHVAPQTINLPLKLDNGQLDYSTFTLIMQLKMSYISCWNVPYIISFILENVILGSLKPFFQVDPQVDINLYLAEANSFRHSRQLTALKSSWCSLSPISLFGFPDFKISFISLEADVILRNTKISTWIFKCICTSTVQYRTQNPKFYKSSTIFLGDWELEEISFAFKEWVRWPLSTT